MCIYNIGRSTYVCRSEKNLVPLEEKKKDDESSLRVPTMQRIYMYIFISIYEKVRIAGMI